MPDWQHHPEEADLLRYSDGELRAGDTERIARHLEACWDCRTRLDDLKNTIAEYVRYRRSVLEPGFPPPPQDWQNLSREFVRIQAAAEPSRPWRRIFERRAVWLLAGTLTAGTGIFYYATKQRPVERPAAPATSVSQPAPAVMPAGPEKITRAIPPTRKAAQPAPGPEDELRVIAALDRIGADLGDPVAVTRASNRIVVTCIGLDARRTEELRDALKGLPQVSIEASPKASVSTGGSPVEVTGVTQGAVPAAFAGQFSSPAAYEKFVDGLLKNTDSIMARAHALRLLATRFPPEVESAMSADGKATLTTIRLQHEMVLARELATLDRSTQPYLGPMEIAPGSGAGGERWQARSLRVFTESEQVDRLAGSIFAGSDKGGVQSTPAALAAALAKLKADAEPR